MTLEKVRMDCWKVMVLQKLDCGHRRYTFPGRWKIQGHKAEVVDRVVFVAMRSPFRLRRRERYQGSRRHTHRCICRMYQHKDRMRHCREHTKLE